MSRLIRTIRHIGEIAEINARTLKGDFPHSIIEYIDISSVGTGTFNNLPKRIELAKAPSRARRLVLHGDTIISTVRPNRRSFMFLKEPMPNTVVSTGFAVLTPKEEIDSRYLYYWISQPAYSDFLASRAKGAAYPAVDTESIVESEILLPPLPVQRRIVGILSAYDDLIENNTRRIQILEQMAQSIYREWFVHFRFPGHEKVKLVETPLGKIPQGWEAKNLFEVAEVTYGFPFKSTHFSTELRGLPIIRIRDIQPNFSATYTEETAEPKHIVENGDLLVGMDGDFHMGKWAGGKAWINQRVVRFRPKTRLGRYHLFLALEKPIHHFDSTIVGTTVAHLGDRDLRATFLPIPPDPLVKLVSETLEPLFDLELNLRLKNTNLRRTRDVLLPRLISGELCVENTGGNT